MLIKKVKMINQIKSIFQDVEIQRLFYCLGILLWTTMMWGDDLDEPAFSTNFTTMHVLVWGIPDAILVFQIIFINRIIWMILVVCVLLLSVLMTLTVLASPLPGIIISGLFMLMSLVLFLMEPKAEKK